ncbi:uncharacterized protein [Rutidosis leptorrhynchoides]|uniref:uncharacterized protein n=1 Tax=Rutidosis leptorrhynchoides TaxID=125765 RepID=UPI003A9A29CC
MSSTITRFIVADPSLYLKPNGQVLLFNPISKTHISMKNFLWKFHAKSWNLQTTTFVRQSSVNPPPEPPIPSGSPSGSGSLRNWIVGIALTFILPFFTHKWGSLLLLKTKVEKNIETTEEVVKSIGKVAEKVDKVIDSITDDLPNDSKLKKALERADELVEGVAKTAHVADDFIIKVEEAEDKLESLIIQQENSKREAISKVDEDKEDQEDIDKNIK